MKRLFFSQRWFSGLLVLFGLLLFCCIACSPFGIRDDYQLVFPDIQGPEENPHSLWDLSWYEIGGSVLTRRVDSSDVTTLSLFREVPVILTARPVSTDFPYEIRAAGFLCISPARGTDELLLSWEDGFAAAFLLELADTGISPYLVNIDRFRDAVTDRIGDNPWLTDTRKLSSDLQVGELWIYSFRPRVLFPVDLTLPPGIWYPGYPLEARIVSNGDINRLDLPAGIHYFRRMTDNQVASVAVDERGEVLLVCF